MAGAACGGCAGACAAGGAATTGASEPPHRQQTAATTAPASAPPTTHLGQLERISIDFPFLTLPALRGRARGRRCQRRQATPPTLAASATGDPRFNQAAVYTLRAAVL